MTTNEAICIMNETQARRAWLINDYWLYYSTGHAGADDDDPWPLGVGEGGVLCRDQKHRCC